MSWKNQYTGGIDDIPKERTMYKKFSSIERSNDISKEWTTCRKMLLDK